MTFTEKISSIEKVLGKNNKFKDKTLLACAIYLKIKLNLSFRKLSLVGVPFTWYNLRYWLQKLEREHKLQNIRNIVRGDSHESCSA